ncbi:DUF2521 family protein [Bacillus taeanensis]|uniref:DUF2521 domain-containing protein n=1 Tax=Bacillus taeanensis TaxID=273032 RepID=A0A366XV07_9BACI|nr:DUF2521 family protein [Bacillus taeanensis]RBW67791.1 DUF2521 domain-containing protein [Bacillus taeanensis]
MKVITNFYEKKRKKRMQFERNMLKQLSLSKINKDVQLTFMPFLNSSLLMQEDLENICVDLAIEAYLIGAEFSKFGYYGEEREVVRRRSTNEENILISTLFDYWRFWNANNTPMEDSIWIACESFISKWWSEGFELGQKRRRLRLQ